MSSLSKLILNDNDLRSKKAIQSEASDYVGQLLEEGNISPLRVLINIRRLQDYLTQCSKELEYHAVTEYMSHNEKNLNIQGVTTTEVKGSDLLDYEQDIVYAEIKQKLAARKKMIDVATKTGETIADENGCVIPIVKVKSVRKSSFQIKY